MGIAILGQPHHHLKQQLIFWRSQYLTSKIDKKNIYCTRSLEK